MCSKSNIHAEKNLQIPEAEAKSWWKHSWEEGKKAEVSRGQRLQGCPTGLRVFQGAFGGREANEWERQEET